MSTWPVDDLSGTQLDQGSDSPAAARAQLYALLGKVKAILAAFPSGGTLIGLHNDGVGSELDADLLDGHSSSYFLAASSYTAADVLAKLLTVDGSGSGLDADLLDGHSSSYFTDIAARLGFTPANKAGDTFSGPVVLPGNASSALHAVPLQQLVINLTTTGDGTNNSLTRDPDAPMHLIWNTNCTTNCNCDCSTCDS